MIDATYMLGVYAALIGVAFTVIAAMIAWNWNRLHAKVDKLVDALQHIAEEIRDEMRDHEVRLTVLEEHHKNCNKK